MDIRLVMKTARSATFELDDGGAYETFEKYRLFLDHKECMLTNTVITSIYDLKPDTEYELEVHSMDGTNAGSIKFRTDEEFVTINVKELGAAGDGESDIEKKMSLISTRCVSGYVNRNGKFHLGWMFP